LDKPQYSQSLTAAIPSAVAVGHSTVSPERQNAWIAKNYKRWLNRVWHMMGVHIW